ncbi:protein obstructor-E isoform X1 [Coccinella septempunctata]|uniref:protein obstructor-E isoform X1 n=1 Tax=Coccinella septempunctata TaxID=41139 RepID=UPI001D081611|nr:protein obstructor-E isoform X1 [Coccinella septempunctata]
MNVFVTAALLVLSVVSAQGAVLGSPQCPDPNGVFAYEHPESCNLFFLCTNGTLTVETCENGLLFDGKGNVHHHCNYNWAVDCGTRKADLTPISTPGCEYQFGIYPESHECSTHYIKCAHGEPQANQCEPGLVYDERIHGCNWPDLLLETCNPEAVVGFKCPTKVPSHTVSAKFWPYPRFAVPGDCHRLITCVNGFPRLISCGEGKVLDESTLTCEEPELVPQCANHLRK